MKIYQSGGRAEGTPRYNAGGRTCTKPIRLNMHQDEHSEYRQDPVPQQRALANYLYIKDEFEEAKQSK